MNPPESTSVPPAPAREQLHFSTKLAYGAGDMGPAIAANILVFFLLYFLTNVAGLPAGLAGSILAISKISDAVNDPIAGILSDRTRTRWGRRIPWMLAGIIPFGLLLVAQWWIPEPLATNHWGLFIYYTAIAVLFNIAYTVVNLPYTALTPELTQDYNERTSLNSYRFAFSIGGSVLSLIIANLVFVAFPEASRTQYLVLGIVSSGLSMVALLWCTLRIQERGAQPLLSDRQKHRWGIVLSGLGIGIVAWVVKILLTKQFFLLRSPLALGQLLLITLTGTLFGLLVIGFGLTLWWARTEAHLLPAVQEPRRSPDSLTPANASPLSQLKIALANRAFLYVIAIYLCSWLAVQLTASILIYYVVGWVGLDETQFPTVAIAVQGTALAMLFVWRGLSDRIGKKAVYIWGSLLWIGAEIGLFALQPGQVTQLYCLAVLAGCGVSVAYLIPWSMIPDVIELDELQTGQRREGIFYSFMVLLQKVGLALALLIVGQILELAGFAERLPGEPIPVQPDSALFAIRFMVGPLPTIALICGLIAVYFYPLTQAVHEEIRLKLQARKQTMQS